MRDARLFVEGAWRDGATITDLTDKYTGAPIGRVHEAGRDQVDRALAGVAAGRRSARLVPYRRYEILARAAELIAERSADFIDSVIDDTGFTVADATREVDRAVQTMLLSAEEARRIHGEVVPVASAPGGRDRLAFTVRHPLGVICAITPFNSPLNTVVHKVGPALAAGNAVVLKPASATPLTAGLLLDTLLRAGLPPELIALVQGPGSTVGQWLLESPVPDFYAFTGSTEVGEHIHRTIGLRRTQLELGSLSSTLVCADADLARAATACVGAAFRKAGQVCTSVQRIYVQSTAVEEFTERLARELAARSWGDPRLAGTFVGPVISAREADRIESWIGSAVTAGARVVAGGGRSGQVVEPTILTRVPRSAEVMCREIFGPVVGVVEFDDLDRAIADINDTPYGLAAGIFTRDINQALTAASELRMGSVHINETSSNRVDLMPYGGVKQSGFGLEGPRYAIEEMTEQRLITMGPA